MGLLNLVVVAVVQGLTEFLPISSSAHLILVPAITNWPDQGQTVDIAVHFGTLAAVMLYLRNEVSTMFFGWLDLLKGRFTADARLFSLIAIGAMPALVIGYILASNGYTEKLRSPVLIAWSTVIFGILLWFLDSHCRRFRQVQDLGFSAVIYIGLAQVLAFIPGTSRSGITITAARGLGFNRQDAARISLLLSIPVILAATGYQAFDVFQSGQIYLGIDAVIASVLAFATALTSVAFMMRWLKQASFLPFVIYRLFLGVIMLYWIYV